MNKRGEWSLAPAYDVTYSYNPQGLWTSTHQMSINGKRDNFTRTDLIECAKKASISKKRAREIIDDMITCRVSEDRSANDHSDTVDSPNRVPHLMLNLQDDTNTAAWRSLRA